MSDPTAPDGDDASGDLWLVGAAGIIALPAALVAAMVAWGIRRGRLSPVACALTGAAATAGVVALGGGGWYADGLVAVLQGGTGQGWDPAAFGLTPLAISVGVLAGPVLDWAYDFWWPDPNAHAKRAKRTLSAARRRARRAPTPPPIPGRITLGRHLAGEHPDLVVRHHHQRVVALPTSWLDQHLLVAGATGTGKTVTILIIAMLALQAGFRVILVDGKPSPAVAAELEQLAAREGIAFNTTTRAAIDAWRGSPDDLLDRLLATQDFTEPYWQAATATVLRLALHAPDRPTPNSWDQLLPLLDKTALLKAWRGHPAEIDLLTNLTAADIASIAFRYHGIAHTLGGALDGTWTWDDADLAYVAVGEPGRSAQARAVAGWLIEDLMSWAAGRRRDHRPTLILFDEFSRVAAYAPAAVDCVERSREHGVGIALIVQDWTGLGPDDLTRRRLAGAVRTIITHRLADPEAIANLAGTHTTTEDTIQLGNDGPTGRGSRRATEQYKVHPQLIRELRVGEIVVIADGHACLAAVPPPSRQAVTPGRHTNGAETPS